MKGQTKRILVVRSKRTPSCKWPITSGFIIIIIIIIIIILSIPEKGAKGQTQGEKCSDRHVGTQDAQMRVRTRLPKRGTSEGGPRERSCFVPECLSCLYVAWVNEV